MASNRFSYSKVDVYKSCPFKYLLQYVEGPYISVPGVALDVGNMIHSAEESIANCIKVGAPIDYVSIKNKVIIETLRIEHKFPRDFYEPDKANRYYKEKIYEYLDKNVYRLAAFMAANPDLEMVGAEVPFKVELFGKTFTGKIDRVLRNKATGEYICHDIKSWAVPAEDKELATPLQFVVYTEAIKSLYGVAEDMVSCAYDLPFCDMLQPAGTKGYMKRGLDKLEKLLNGIAAGDWTPNPTALCHWCQYCPTNPNQPREGKNRCPYHSMWTRETKDNNVAMEWMGMDNHKAILEAYVKKASK